MGVVQASAIAVRGKFEFGAFLITLKVTSCDVTRLGANTAWVRPYCEGTFFRTRIGANTVWVRPCCEGPISWPSTQIG